DLFLSTTVGTRAVETLGAMASRIPLGDWQAAAYWVTGYRGFTRRALAKLGVPLAGALALPAAAVLWLKDAGLARALPACPAGFAVAQAGGFDSRFDDFWQEL